MIIAVASDHAGYALKEKITKFMESMGGCGVKDLGTFSPASTDYNEFARKVAEGVANGDYERGLLICGTGEGMAIQANRYKGVRAAKCLSVEQARDARHHNDANVLCLGAKYVSLEASKEIVKAFLETAFEAVERRLRRTSKLDH